MPDYADLIERLEKATGPDSWLDHLIEEEVGEWKNQGGGRSRHKVTGEVRVYVAAAPLYTSSLDAALSLVPEGCFYTVTTRHHLGVCSAEAFVWSQTDECLGRATAKTAELSLGAAALKARQAAS